MNKEISLEYCLREVEKDATKQAIYAKSQIGKEPFPNRSQDEHDTYWQQRLLEADTAINFCFIRLMQINPD